MNERRYEHEDQYRRHAQNQPSSPSWRPENQWRDQDDRRFGNQERPWDSDGNPRMRQYVPNGEDQYGGGRQAAYGERGERSERSERWDDRSGDRSYESYGRSNRENGWRTGMDGRYGTMERGAESAGQFSGRGPKNYRRSDDRIREEVAERLTDEPGVDASDIEIEVKDGHVTLTGTVTDRQQKRRAEDAAESCAGVSDVSNQLRVGTSGQSAASSGQNQSTRTSGGSQQTTSNSRRSGADNQ